MADKTQVYWEKPLYQRMYELDPDAYAAAITLSQAPQYGTVTISASGTVSSSLDLGAFHPRGLAVIIPSAWSAADLGFQGSWDNSTFYPLYDNSGSEVKVSGIGTAEARVYSCPAECWALGNFEYLRVKSLDTSGTAGGTAQAAQRSIAIMLLS